MDFQWLADNASLYIQALSAALAKKRTFLNFNPAKFFYLYNITLILKCIFSGYGMAKVVPVKVTYIFLLLVVSANFVQIVICETARHLAGEIVHALCHIGILALLPETREHAPYMPNVAVWWWYSFYVPAEFFIDCYFTFVVFFFIWKSYSARPHKLSSIICLMFTVNWVADQFANGSTDILDNIKLYYVPLILLQAFNEGDELRVFSEAFGAVWVIKRLLKHDFALDVSKTPAGRSIESLVTHFEDWSVGDYLSEIGKRKSFLNVNAKEHSLLFHAVLILKSFIASYAVRNVVGVYTSLKMMFVNALLNICDRSVYALLAGFIRFVFMAGYQCALHIQEYHLALSSGIWYWVCWDDYFQFFLDVFLLISAWMYTRRTYKGEWDKMASLMCLLYFVDWFGDQFIGEPLGRLATIATLYVPVVLITSCKELRRGSRVLLMLAFIAFWLVFKHEQEYFEYGIINKYIYNFYETAKAFIRM